MNSGYVMPLKAIQELVDDLDYTMVLNDSKEIVWVNEKAARFFQSDLCMEHHIDPSSIGDWYNYLKKVRKSTIKKSYLSLLDKKKRRGHFIAYGMFDNWNKTYVVNFRPVADQLSLIELYDKAFKMLDEIHIGAFVSRVNGFIFSANETAKYIVPNACQMSIVDLLMKFLKVDQFAHYIKLLNNRQSFSVDVTCQATKDSYQLMYRFDHEFEMHFITLQHLLLKDMADQQTRSTDYLDKQTVASIVHEIRNPLTALQGFVDLMKNDASHQDRYLQIIDNELRRMEYLLSGMLQLLKPKIESTPIECNSFLQKMLLLLETDVKNKNICLVYGQSAEPCYILGNEYSLTQIFFNIIKNSVQAMGENGSITITFNKTPSNELEVCIKDSGIGMSKEQLDNLFTPYFTTKADGTGLGLSIVKKLLEEMGGRIEVQSELGRGTEVYIYLRLANVIDREI